MAFKNDNQEVTNATYTYQVKRAKEINDKTVMFDMIVNGITIYGCAVKKANTGKMFISFPSRKGSDEKYYNFVYFPMKEELQAEIIKAVVAMI